MLKKSWILSLLLLAGLLSVWIGERIVDGDARTVFTAGGALLMALATGLRFTRVNVANSGQIERSLLGLHALALLSVGLYVWQSDLWAKVAGQTLETDWPKLAGAVTVLVPCVLVLSLIPTLLVELSYAAMAKAPVMEIGRVQEATNAGLGLGFVLIFAFALQYVVTERDLKRDFSYFRTARPGEATARLINSLDEPLEVFLFFPPASDVSTYVQAYFDELKEGSSMLKVQLLDQALEPVKSKDLGVSNNGSVVLKKGGRKETIFLGTEAEKSRTQLRGLDVEVQKRVLQIAKSKRTVYMTSGHGERTQDPVGGEQRATIDILWRTLQDQNFEVRTLSAAEGLGQDVPRDAAAVFVIGPTRAFTPPEAQALEAYGKRGGKLFIAIDPEAAVPFDELLQPLGLSFKAEVLTDDKSFARMRAQASPSDRRNIGTRTFSSHPSVTYLSRSQQPVLLVGAGPVNELQTHPADLVIDLALRTQPSSWNDTNNNFEHDPPAEVRQASGVLAAVSRRASTNKVEDELRALVLADSDAIADEVLPLLQGNQYLVVDGLKWLLGEEQLQGSTNSELDVPMTRTRKEDSVWFYGTTFLAPVLVLGLGFVVRRRTSRPRKQQEVKS
ncbi:MAG: Gldg family protein [Myxococcaceae bacterium]|nr:Gldg family protein [Myxococcaceae bacterium]